MALPAFVQFTLILLLFAVGFLIERDLPPERTWVGLTSLGQLLVMGLAVGSVLVLTQSEFTVLGFDETVVAVAVMSAILLGAPFVLPTAEKPEKRAIC